MTTKLNTVNVIEYIDGAVYGVSSFPETKEGIDEAENLFKACITVNDSDVTPDDLEACIEDGVFTSGTYEVYLAHSN